MAAVAKLHIAEPNFSLSQFENYRTATAKVSSLRTRTAELRRRIEDVQAALWREAQKVDADIEDRARALIAGQPVPRGDASHLRDELAGVEDELKVTEAALRLARQDLDEVRARRSSEILNRYRGEHRALARAVADAYDALAAAVDAERAFRAEMRAGGCSAVPPAMDLPIERLATGWQAPARRVAEIRAYAEPRDE